MLILNPWFAKALVLTGIIATLAIRAPHGRRSRSVKIVKSRMGPMETILLTLVSIGFLVPLIWIASPWLRFADYPLRVVPYLGGTVCLAIGLWCFWRSHADLGINWSVTLEVRESHQLVTTGIYERVRHPMYAALLLCAAGQSLLLPNWIAGPFYLVSIVLLVALRLGPEEQIMVDEFGDQYGNYSARTKRLVPRIW